MANNNKLMVIDPNGNRRVARQPNPQELFQIARMSRADVAQSGGSCNCEAIEKKMTMLREAMKNYFGGSGGLREVVREEIRSAVGDANGGRITWGDRDQYMPGGRIGGEAGKGGVLASDAVAVPDGAAAGTELVGAWSGNALARLTGEKLCSLTALLDPALAQYSDHLQFELLINGDLIPSLNEIPGDYIAKTADGQIQRYPLNSYRVPYDTVLGFRLQVVHDIPPAGSGGPGETSARLRVETGNSCPTA